MVPLLIPLILAAGCAPRPGIIVFDRPVSTPAHRKLIDPSSYSDITEGVLAQEELESTVRTDPAAAVRDLIGKMKPQGDVNLRVAAAEIALKTAYQWQDQNLEAALGIGLASIDISQSAPGFPPSEARDQLLTIYNEASGAFASVFHDSYGPGSKVVTLPGATRSYRVAWAPPGKGRAKLGFYDTISPASFLEIEGFDERYQQAGIGGAVVGYREGTAEHRAEDPFMPPVGYAVALTSLVRVNDSGSATITLHELQDQSDIVLSGKRYPLTADYTAPLALLAERRDGQKSGFLGMLRPQEVLGEEGLYLMTPYQKDRIPLILVHGLMSSPATWREVATACYADPFLRRNYQVLGFYYPTGYPIPRNAERLRAALKRFKKHHDPKGNNPKMRKMVMVGHSMGSILTSYQIRPGGDPLWNQVFTKPIGEIEMNAEEREKLEAMIYFKANPDIARAIFICGPHRGSQYADYQIGRLGARLINFPVRMLDDVSDGLRGATTDLGGSFLSKPKTSIDNLKVNSTVLTTILEQPLTYKPPFHSIIGDRGKGDSPDSSDGVVPYWSSHLEGAASEKIIAVDHNATNDSETVHEVRRILYLHLGKTYDRFH